MLVGRDYLLWLGEFDPLNFTWEGLELDAEGRRIVVAGNTDSFKVGARDSFGNTLASGGLAVGGILFLIKI